MNTEHYKAKLIEEKSKLVRELQSVSRNVGADDWEAKSVMEIDRADETEVASKFEELSINNAITSDLEKQLKDVDDALAKIDNGTYGICEVSGQQIEEDRLEANPAARTCKEHM